jgi:hypothetical protein
MAFLWFSRPFFFPKVPPLTPSVSFLRFSVSEVEGRTVKRLASFRLSDGELEVNLVEFTRVNTGDQWVKRVVGYIPDGRQYPTRRMFLDPPTDWETQKERP